MKLRRYNKILSILVTLSMLLVLLVPLATPAAASSTYTTLSMPTVLNNDTRQNLATIQIDIPTVTGSAYSTILVTLPTDFEIDWSSAANSPAVSLVKTGKTAGGFSDTSFAAGNAAGNDGTHFWNNGIVYVSDREFKVTYYANASDYDVRLLVTLPRILVPSSADGDIKVVIDKLTGDFSGGNVVVGTAGSGAVTVYVNNTVTFTSEGTTARQVEIYLKENSQGAVKIDDPTVKFKLPKGMTWSDAAGESPVVTNLTDGLAPDLTAAVGSDERVLEIARAAITDPKSIYKVAGTVKVDEEEAVLGEVNVAVSGASSTSPGSIVIGDYVDYGISVVAAEDPKAVIPGGLGQDVADFNIEENAKGSIINNRSITLELPDGVKWAELTASHTGSLGGEGTITRVGTTGRKIKFTATNSATPSKGKFKFENVSVDVAVDFTGDIKVKVNGAGIDNQEVIIAKALPALTATATTPEVKIGMQDQAGGTVKIVESAAETLINGKDLTVTAPEGVRWCALPTVKVTEGDLSIDTEGVTKSGSVLTIPIKSQSTKASTIEISDVKFTVDRTVPEGYISLDIGGPAIDEVNDPDETTAITRAYYDIPTDGLIFDGRDVAVSVDAAKTITPAPGEEKSTAVFKIGDTKFTLNGVEQTMDAAPYLKNDRTYLPLRFVAKAVGVADSNILWNAAEQSVVLIKGDRVVKMNIGNTTMFINGIAVQMDVAPEVVDPGRTMLPVRWVAQALGADIAWDAATQTVTVN